MAKTTKKQTQKNRKAESKPSVEPKASAVSATRKTKVTIQPDSKAERDALQTQPNKPVMSDSPLATKRTALGRGLSALLGDADNTVDAATTSAQVNMSDYVKPRTAAAGISEIAIERIETNPYQPRTHFDQTALQELADSIKVQGIIQPITVRRLSEGQYQLISGERRLQASKLAGLKAIPAYVRTANDEQMLEMALIENIQRENLNAIEVAVAYKRLIDELGIVMEEVGEKVGKNRATVNNYLRLLKLPAELQAALRDEKITMGHARALITVENPVFQLDLFREILEKELSVRQVEEQVRLLSKAAEVPKEQSKPASQEPVSSIVAIQLRELQRQLETKYNTRVRLSMEKDSSGEIRIAFFSQEELDRLLEMLR